MNEVRHLVKACGAVRKRKAWPRCGSCNFCVVVSKGEAGRAGSNSFWFAVMVVMAVSILQWRSDIHCRVSSNERRLRTRFFVLRVPVSHDAAKPSVKWMCIEAKRFGSGRLRCPDHQVLAASRVLRTFVENSNGDDNSDIQCFCEMEMMVWRSFTVSSVMTATVSELPLVNAILHYDTHQCLRFAGSSLETRENNGVCTRTILSRAR